MKNNYLIKKPKRYLIAFLVLFCALFANSVMGQTYTWIGANSSWETAANWATTSTSSTTTYTAGVNTFVLTAPNGSIAVGGAVLGIGIPAGTTITATDGTNVTISANTTIAGTATTVTFPAAGNITVPGSLSTDLVVISNGGNPTISTAVGPITRLTVNNASGTASTLTINSSGGILAVSSASISNVLLNGGNIVNNGTLDITSTAVAASTFGITCGNPATAPALATEYVYSGTGLLKVTISTGGASSAAIGVSSTLPSSLATYKFLFDGTTNFTFNPAIAAHAIRSFFTTAGNVPFPVIIGGAGFTMGTVGSPVNGGLLNLGSIANVTVNAGTTLTMNSASTNLSSGIVCGNSANNTPTVFTNKGRINILGPTQRNGLSFSTFGGSAGPPSVASTTPQIINFTNEGTIIVDINSSVAGFAAYAVTNGGGGAAFPGSAVPLLPASTVNLTNTSTGILTLKNTSILAGTGNTIYCFTGGEGAFSAFVNNGILNLEGTVYSYGTKTTVTNNSIINSNSDFRSFTSLTNNIGGSVNFVRTAATATTRQVTFNGVPALTTSGAVGSTYQDTNLNTYAVVTQKFGSGTTLVANVLSGATVITSGTLTRISGAGAGIMSYTSVSIPALNGALSSTTTNSGTINTDTASNLNIVSGVTTTANSIIAPGGSAGKGIADFAKAAAVLTGKTILQISGDATAGVNYDQITNSTVAGTLSVAGTLDITGIYTPGGPVAIDIVTTEATGSLTGTFGTVIGITTGWTVDYSTAGKVQLVYNPTPTVTNPIWIGVTSTGWITASNWDTGVVPDQNSNVTIGVGTVDPPSFQPSPFVNVNIKSLTINSGATLQVNPGFNFTVKEAITNNGTLTVLNNANLIQVDNVANTGNITVNRNSNLLSRLDYTLWSSPMTISVPQSLSNFSPATDVTRFYTYNEGTNFYNAVPAATAFVAGTGYLIRMPNTAVTAPSTQTFVGVFTGVPNNGDVSKTITYNGSAPFGYNAIGNPYPSTIDAAAFITANTANIESSLYFWRKINGAAGSAYAVYNPMGATTATPSSALPNGTIQVGQGFFVKAKSGPVNVNFTNAMRVANNSGQFFKTKQVTQKDRVWLNLTNTAGAFSQALIGYTADATSGVDRFDAKYINDSPTALTSSINSDEYTIQGRPAFDVSDVVALNFKTTEAGDYTIALDQFDGVFATGQDVYLLDSKTGIETNLKTGSYTFAATAGVDNTRFSLKYQKTLKVDAPAFNENSVRVYKNNGALYVNSGTVAISNIKVFDIQGRLIAEQKNVKATSAVINNLRANHQVLIVKIASEVNNEVTKKVVN